MFDFYLRMLPYVEERTKVQFRNTSTPITAGALYEETCTQFGLYNEVSPELRSVVRGLAWALERTGSGKRQGFVWLTVSVMYGQGDWGCGSPTRKYGASSNTYIRFHFTGSLELSLMLLDDWVWNGDEEALRKYLPIAVAVVEGFRQRFPNRDAHGKIDMWPAQVGSGRVEYCTVRHCTVLCNSVSPPPWCALTVADAW
jgi:hypothetical protein